MRRTRLATCLVLLALAGGCAQAGSRLPLVRAEAGPPATVLAQTLTAPPPPPPPPAAPAPAPDDPWPVVDRGVQVPGPTYQVVSVTAPAAAIFDSPTAPAPRLRLSNKTEHGLARVFLVVGQDGDRWRVLLPIRPNGSIGWLRASDVSIQNVNTWIRVQLGAHLLTAGDGTDVVMREPVAVGTGGTPTPTGTYYLLELTGLAKGVLMVAHTDAAPRGFTLLCRRLGARVAEVGSSVLGVGITREWTWEEAARLQTGFAELPS